MSLKSNFKKAVFFVVFFLVITSCDRNKDKIEIEYTTSKFDATQDLFLDIVKQKHIDPKNSALVLIDVWQRDFLRPMVNNFINPLIKDFEKRGFRIIYAPSQESQHKDLLKVDSGITFYHSDTMDSYVKKNQIKNLFYLCFDALYCVIDKPNGLYSFKKRNDAENLNYFVFEKGIMSYSKGMKEVAAAIFKKNDIGVVVTDSINFDNIYPSGDNKYLRSKTRKTLRRGNNLVLIFEDEKTRENLENFKKLLKKSNITYFTVKNNKLNTKKETLETDDEFIDLLAKQKINNIYYAGYHLNNEIL